MVVAFFGFFSKAQGCSASVERLRGCWRVTHLVGEAFGNRVSRSNLQPIAEPCRMLKIAVGGNEDFGKIILGGHT